MKTSALALPLSVHEPHVAARGDCRNQTHAMASACRLDDGRVAFRLPCASRVMIGDRVSEIDVRLLFFSHRLDFLALFLSHCRTRDSSRSIARCNGFWRVMPICANNRPTELAASVMLNFLLISAATMSRVHNFRFLLAMCGTE
jgi:hypothetical protein